jgi:hypothetical protein
LDKLPQEYLINMKELLGDEYDAFVETYSQPAFRGLRWNMLKGKTVGRCPTPRELLEKLDQNLNLKSANADFGLRDEVPCGGDGRSAPTV